MKHHVFGVTQDAAGGGGELWHVPLGDPGQPAFGDVDCQTGARPWKPERVVDVACAADSAGNLHVLLVTSGGRLWHTVRAQNGFWTTHSSATGSSGDVGRAVAGETGRFEAVAANCEGTTLHVLAVTDDQNLYEATRAERPGTEIRDDGTWSRFSPVDWLDGALGSQLIALAATTSAS